MSDGRDHHEPTAAVLKDRIDRLTAQIATLEALVADRQDEVRNIAERDRMQHLLADILKMTADLMAAREMVATVQGELNELRARRAVRPWWQKLVSG